MSDPVQGSAATVPTWQSEIVRAGLDGLHKIDCWADDHADCREIVHAVLTGLAGGGYKLVQPKGEVAESGLSHRPAKAEAPFGGPEGSNPSLAARDRRDSLRLDFLFGGFWIVMAVAALFVPPQDLWPALLCVSWAALGGYIVGLTAGKWREERDHESAAVVSAGAK